MSAKFHSFVDKALGGVCLAVTEFDDSGKRTVYASVVYTPEIIRGIARDLLIEADKADALGGPSEKLKSICVAATRDEGRS